MPDAIHDQTVTSQPLSDDPSDLPIAVVGAGFSGTLLAVNLARRGARVVLVERDHRRLARGLAFGTSEPDHLLNVRASNMSAYPEDPGHFLRWMGYAGTAQVNRFVPRLTYGYYLREQLLDLLASAPGRIAVKQQEAVGIGQLDGAAVLHLDSGETIRCKAVVLALGNLAPAGLPVLGGIAPPVLIDNPWSAQVAANLDGAEHVLLVGTGLTAVDVVLSLDRAGYRGRITALSRRGLAPHAHAAQGPAPGHVPRPEVRGSWLLRHVRQRAAQVGWREAVDELRPHTQSLWRLHDTAAQARFLRHLRPWWDIHRHRLAPPVAERIATLRAQGRLRVQAGRLLAVQMREGRAEVTWRPRGGHEARQMSADRIIICTGPEGDLRRCDHPLLSTLLAQGHVRGDAHQLGLDVDRNGRVINRDGVPQEQLYAVGPITKGEAWEVIAVPDIRRQVWELARYLTHSHWVGGEGL